MDDRSKFLGGMKRDTPDGVLGQSSREGERVVSKLEGQSSVAYGNSHIGHLLLGGHVMAFLQLPQESPQDPGGAGQFYIQSSPQFSQMPRSPKEQEGSGEWLILGLASPHPS